MSRAFVPPQLRRGPFLGSSAVDAGLVTKRQLDSGPWLRLLSDVYLRRDAVCDHLTWCEAVALRLPPGAAISGAAALGLYRPELAPAPGDPFDVTVPRPAAMRSSGRIRVHRSALAPAELRTMGGFPVTTPLRTAFDLARKLDRLSALIAVEALLTARLVTLDGLDSYLHASIGRRGWTQLAAVREMACAGVESPMETRTRLLIIAAGLPVPVVQHQVFDASGCFVARLDLAYPEWKIGIEYDGEHHRERDVFRRDADRLNRLQLAGWRVLRFTADDVLRHPERLVVRIRAFLPA